MKDVVVGCFRRFIDRAAQLNWDLRTDLPFICILSPAFSPRQGAAGFIPADRFTAGTIAPLAFGILSTRRATGRTSSVQAGRFRGRRDRRATVAAVAGGRMAAAASRLKRRAACTDRPKLTWRIVRRSPDTAGVDSSSTDCSSSRHRPAGQMRSRTRGQINPVVHFVALLQQRRFH